MQIFLVQPIVARLGEKGALVLSQVAGSAKFLGLAAAQSKLGVYGTEFVGALTGLSVPTITSIKANAVEEHEQGAVQGALSGAQALASGFGPLVFMQIWRLCTQTLSPPQPRVRSRCSWTERERACACSAACLSLFHLCASAAAPSARLCCPCACTSVAPLRGVRCEEKECNARKQTQAPHAVGRGGMHGAERRAARDRGVRQPGAATSVQIRAACVNSGAGRGIPAPRRRGDSLRGGRAAVRA